MIGQRLILLWLIQILDGGRNEGFKGSRGFPVGILYILPGGEGRNGRVRSGWGQITFWLPFAVFLSCTIAPDCAAILQEMLYILFSFGRKHKKTITQLQMTGLNSLSRYFVRASGFVYFHILKTLATSSLGISNVCSGSKLAY